jgi:cobalt/nickel transport system permease protein
MLQIESAFLDLGHLDRLGGGDSAVHRLDPRAKLLTTLVFVSMVVSHGKYELSGLLPFLLFPVVLATTGRLPLLFLLKRLLLVAPFAVLVGVLNPLLDRAILYRLGPVGISGGWVSFLSILLRFCLSISAAFILIATSGFYELCLALEKLRVPKAFVVQLLLLYRYLFVLVEEAIRLARARALRSFGGKGTGLRIAGSLLGHLLLRTLQRARRIYLAMACRGFNGDFHPMRTLSLTRPDVLFTLGWSSLFVLMRLVDLPQKLGNIMTAVFP